VEKASNFFTFDNFLKTKIFEVLLISDAFSLGVHIHFHGGVLFENSGDEQRLFQLRLEHF